MDFGKLALDGIYIFGMMGGFLPKLWSNPIGLEEDARVWEAIKHGYSFGKNTRIRYIWVHIHYFFF